MLGMPTFMGIWGGIRVPNGLKVTSVHLVCCGITTVKADVLTQSHFFWKFVPESSHRKSLPSGVTLTRPIRARGILLKICIFRDLDVGTHENSPYAYFNVFMLTCLYVEK